MWIRRAFEWKVRMRSKRKLSGTWYSTGESLPLRRLEPPVSGGLAVWVAQVFLV